MFDFDDHDEYRTDEALKKKSIVSLFEYPAHSQIQKIQTVAGGLFVILHYVT